MKFDVKLIFFTRSYQGFVHLRYLKYPGKTAKNLKTVSQFILTLLKCLIGSGDCSKFCDLLRIVKSNLVIGNFLVTLKLFLNAKCSLSCQLVRGNGSLTPLCSLTNRSLSPSLTVYEFWRCPSYSYAWHLKFFATCAVPNKI